MMTKFDRAYKHANLDEIPQDVHVGACGRRLTQYELRIRSHLINTVSEIFADTQKALDARRDAVAPGHEKHQKSEELKEMACLYEELWDHKHDELVGATKMAWLAGQREGLRLGIGIAMQVLTATAEGGTAEPRIPSTSELLEIILAMSDDSAADILILKAMGAKPDTGDQAGE